MMITLTCCQVVIALTHCGRQRVDEKLSTLDNIDLVFGGHSKSQMESWTLSNTALGLRSTPGYSHLTAVCIISDLISSHIPSTGESND
jgi:2',3'-cyclic-nucleotide 2'-phosphodiesterase (5'-nucleotidase family)